jgi:plastocyanin
MERKTAVRASVAVVVLASALAASAAAQTRSTQKLVGATGKNEAFKITLTNASGKLVKTLKAGTYTFVIHDYSAGHNYELDGPHGKSWTFTTVPFIGVKKFTITLKAGKYKAYCKVHESFMFQHFTVT